MAEPFIKLRGICKSFAGVQALQNIDMEIYEGETRCLAGENGGGKSTLIKVISGFYTPDSGAIEIGGKHYRRLTPQQAIREGIQIIYQDFSVFPNLTVAENIALNSERMEQKRFVNWVKVRRKAQQALEMINIELDLDAKVGDLSVASRQLVAICRALLQDARLLVMDEPTTALTRNEVESLFRVIKGLQQKGIAILFVSHKLEEVFEICDQLTILRNGRKVVEGAMKNFDREKFIYHMTGRTIESCRYKQPQCTGEPLLKAENIGITDLFANISFELYKGEILGITGLLGSGRSELARALFGLEKLTSGEIYLEGRQLKASCVRDIIRQGISYVPEDRLTEGLFLPHTISSNITAATIDQNLNRFGFLDQRQIESAANAWIEEMKIVTPSCHLPVQALSGGNQQKVVLAKWLGNNPKVLILNSPTVGVDIGAKADIQAYTRQLAAQGIGVILISDDIPEIMQTCNRVLVMRKGRIVGRYTEDELDEASLSRKLSAS